jgi:hypothetical protein
VATGALTRQFKPAAIVGPAADDHTSMLVAILGAAADDRKFEPAAIVGPRSTTAS